MADWRGPGLESTPGTGGSAVGSGRTALGFLAFVAVSVAGPVCAQGPEPRTSGYVTLGSGYWRHGLVQNDGGSLTLGVDHERPSGLFAYARATNVDFDVEYYGVERDVEVSAYVGYHERSERWSWTASAGRYAYPGTHGAYDYTELSVNVGWRDRLFYTTSYAPDYYGRPGSALNQEIAFAIPLRGDVEIGGAVGYFDIARGNVEVAHWNLGASKLVGPLAVDLRYYHGDYATGGFLGGAIDAQTVLSVSYALRGRSARR